MADLKLLNDEQKANLNKVRHLSFSTASFDTLFNYSKWLNGYILNQFRNIVKDFKLKDSSDEYLLKWLIG